jgi:hypothetical protein
MGDRAEDAEEATEYYANGKVKFRGANLGDQMHWP